MMILVGRRCCSISSGGGGGGWRCRSLSSMPLSSILKLSMRVLLSAAVSGGALNPACFGLVDEADAIAIRSRPSRVNSSPYQHLLASSPSSPIPAPPSLLLFSPEHPETGFLCDPHQYQGEGAGIQIRKKINNLPNSADFFCFGSSQGHLFFTRNRPSPASILALDPLTGHRFRLPAYPHLPSLGNLSLERSTIDVPKTNTNKNSSEYEDDDDDYDEAVYEGDCTRLVDSVYCYLYNGKAILSPSHDIVVLLCMGLPCFFRRVDDVNSVRGCWTSLQVPVGGRFTDCFFHNGYLHATNHLGNHFVYDLHGPYPAEPISCYLTAPSHPISQIESFFLETNRYFVPSPDGRDLFLVIKGVNPIMDDPDSVSYEDYALSPRVPLPCDGDSPFRAKDFIVFKFFEACGKWKQIRDLGGLALFVGPGQTLCLSAYDFPTLVKPDCIYFTDDCRNDHMFDPKRVGDTGIFNVRDGSIRFYELEHIFMELNWPPPLWFVPSTQQA